MSAVDAVLPQVSAAPTQRSARLGYAAGCFGTDVFWQGTSFFLLFYYTDVLGISSTTAGLVFAAAMIWDGITDPVMGLVANRTHSRFGRYRPYILFGAIPLAASYVVMFAQPFAAAGLIAYTLLAQMLFRTAYTVVSIPYGALSASMTSDAAERSRLATFKVLGGAVAALLVALATQPFVALFPTAAEGWFALSVLFGACSCVALYATYRTAIENADSADVRRPPVRQQLEALWRNPSFIIVIAAIMLSSIASVISSKVTVYYFTYYLSKPDLAGIGLAIQVVAVMACTPLWAWVARRYSKRIAWLGGAAIAIVGQGVFYAYGGTDSLIVMSLVAVIWIGAAAVPVIFWSMAPDTVEVGEWRTGARSEGVAFGIVSLGQKVALGIGIGLTGILLDVIRYVPGAQQTPATLEGMHAMMTLPGLVAAAASGAVMWFYRLDGALHARLVRALQWRAKKRQ